MNSLDHSKLLSDIQNQLVSILSLPTHSLPLDANRHLSSYGLDSLGALELRNQLIPIFGEQLPVMVVLQHPTLNQLVEYLLSRPGKTNPTSKTSTKPSSLVKAQPLSLAQYESWKHQQENPDSCMAHLSLERRILGNLNLEALDASFAQIIKHHAVLRTTYCIEENQVVQHAIETTDLGLQVLDWSDYNSMEQDQRLQRLMKNALQEQPFDLAQLPLWRGYIVRISPNEHYLLLVFHHIQIDTLSFQWLLDECWQLYIAYKKNSPPSLSPIEWQYADYATWQRQRITPEWLANKQRYWQQLLANMPAPIQLSTRRKNTLTATSKVISRSFEGEPTQTLLNFSQQHHVTLFSTLLTAFAIWLSPYSDKSGVLIGAPMSNKRVHQALEHLIGHFAGKALLRVNFADNPTAKQLLGHVQALVIEAFEQQDITYQQLQLIDPSEAQIKIRPFQVMMNFVTAALPTDQQHPELDLEIKPLNKFSYGVAIPELSLIVVYTPIGDHKSLKFNWRYREDLFNADDVKTFTKEYENILKQMLSNIELAISDIV